MDLNHVSKMPPKCKMEKEEEKERERDDGDGKIQSIFSGTL